MNHVEIHDDRVTIARDGAAPVQLEMIDVATTVAPRETTTVALEEENAFEKIGAMRDDVLVQFYADIDDERSRVMEILNAQRNFVADEIKRGFISRDAKEIPHSDFEIALEPQYSAYAFDMKKLKAAAELIPDDDDRAKVYKFHPAYTQPARLIAEREEAGAPVSIKALVKRFSTQTEVGKLLDEAMTRTELEPKLKFKRRQKAVTA